MTTTINQNPDFKIIASGYIYKTAPGTLDASSYTNNCVATASATVGLTTIELNFTLGLPLTAANVGVQPKVFVAPVAPDNTVVYSATLQPYDTVDTFKIITATNPL